MIDRMDIDQIVDVPDTPVRLAKHGMDGRNGGKTENQRSSLPCHGWKTFAEEGSRDQPMIIDSGSPRLFLHPPKCSSSPNNSQRPPTSSSSSLASSSSSSRKANLFRKVTEKKPSNLTHVSMHKHPGSVRTSFASKSSSSSQDDGILDLTERNFHRPACGNASPSAVPENNRANFPKRSVLPNVASFSHEVSNLANASRNGNEEANNASRGGLSIAFGDKKKPDLSLDPTAPARVNKQKRLVRNGCISPNNIAKAKQLVGKGINESVSVAHNNGSMASNSPPVSTNIRELVAEENDSRTRKGKGVISHPYSSKNLHGRGLISSGEKAVETTDYNIGAGKSVEESSSWRSTRNRTRGKGITIANGDNCSENPSFISSEHFLAQSLKESVSHPRARLGRQNGPPRSAADTLIKRQKQGSDLSSYAECSTSLSDDLEVVLLSSPAETANSRSTSSNVNNMRQIIEVDESSPQLRRVTHDEDVRARQLEADELLARELQEQFYNEMPVFGVEEVDLQHQDGPNHGSFRGRQQQVLDARLMSNLHRQSQSRSSSNAPRRGSLARSSTLGRMTRLRNRFPGQPRTLSSSRGRTSMFPPDMDVDMRMHILGALEEFNDMGMNAGILHANRDFNENDYEMLLALDDNISHGGASDRRINGLPQSTVQSDYDEACAICLDTPTVGDTIRHLPCLHKFHKDCIDPWLRRKTSCPVCKSSIT
ncbi:hypothetical protein C2S51_013730 [Perilla frutescens var. frutescens]|nr:hypothetical protein C2S51_013730 [Perilla frutescens var. frutescens]